MRFNCLKARATLRRQFTFYHKVPRNSCYPLYRPWKDERLSQPWSHSVVLNTGPLDWESSTLSTRPLLHEMDNSISDDYFLFLNCYTVGTTPPPPFLQRGVEPPTKFSKRGGLTGPQLLEGVAGKEV